MAITTTLAKLYRYFRGWHEEEYDDIHRVTDDIISDKNNIRASYPISSYGASKIQQQISNISLDNYVKVNPTYNSHINLKATTNALGHVSLVNNLTTSTYQDGKALSANQGFELAQQINNCNDKINAIEQLTSEYNIRVGRLNYKTNGQVYTSEDIKQLTFNFDSDDDRRYGFLRHAKLEIPLYGYVFVVITDKHENPIDNKRVVISLNSVPYFRTTADNGTAAVQFTWGKDDAIKRRTMWSDTWYWIEISLLSNNNNFDTNIHKVVNYDKDFFNHEYGNNEALWRSELNIPSNKTQADYMFNNELRRQALRDDGYPNAISSR